MPNLIDFAFKKAKQENRPALLTYTVAGDNSKKKSLEILKSISDYVDIVEIGFPHNAPTADGPQIQNSSYRALKKGIKLKDYDRTMTPLEFLKNPLFEDYAWRTGFRELRPDEPSEEGDVLLMSIMHPTLNHVAIFLGDMVLHHLADRLSCREPYSEWLLKCTGKRYRYAQKS